MAKLTPTTDNGQVRLPLSVLKLRITDEPEFKTSKKGNKMLVFNYETVSDHTGSTTKVIDGVERNIAGIKIPAWIVVDQAANLRTATEFFSAIGFPLSDVDFNDETGLPEGISFTGMEFFGEVQGLPEAKLDENKQPLLNPLNGKPLQIMRYEVKSYLSA